MFNLLIANRNLQNLQILQNYISIYIPEIRVGHITTNGKEALDILNNQSYDLALIDTNLSEFDSFDIMQGLSAIKKVTYKKSIIVICNNETLAKNLKSHNLIYDTFMDTDQIALIISSLEKLVNAHNQKSETAYIRDRIINELQTIGFNLSHKGTHYLAESVVLIATTPNSSDNLSRVIYPKVSEIFSKDLKSIKCNITSATEAACRNINKDILENYFKLSEEFKPTTKMIIYSILQKLKIRI